MKNSLSLSGGAPSLVGATDMHKDEDHQEDWDCDREKVGVCHWGLKKKKVEGKKGERERKKREHKGRQLSKGLRRKKKKDLNMTNDGLSMFHVKLMQRK